MNNEITWNTIWEWSIQSWNVWHDLKSFLNDVVRPAGGVSLSISACIYLRFLTLTPLPPLSPSLPASCSVRLVQTVSWQWLRCVQLDDFAGACLGGAEPTAIRSLRPPWACGHGFARADRPSYHISQMIADSWGWSCWFAEVLCCSIHSISCPSHLPCAQEQSVSTGWACGHTKEVTYATTYISQLSWQTSSMVYFLVSEVTYVIGQGCRHTAQM